MTDYLYEKCARCHLFIEENYAGEGCAPYVHLHRGDEADEALDSTHDAVPSGQRATIDEWKRVGPPAMLARFTS